MDNSVKAQSSDEKKPVMLLVLGPHRSGTSLTARMLECLGAVNSRNLNPANEYNPKGYFEDWDIYQFNENVLLPEMGSAWHAVSAIDWTSLSRRRYEELQAQAIGLLQQNYDLSSRLSVLKEPRISLLLPFWLEALGTAGFSVKAVCPTRDPLSVARSLTSRDQLPLTSGFLIYLRCWESILKSLQKTPAVFMRFEDILETSKSALKKVAACLHLPLPPDFERRVNDFTEHHLDRRLVHYTPGPEDHQMLSTNPASTALELFAALSKACETQDSSEAKLVCQSAANSLRRSPGYLQALDELSAKQLKHNIDLRCLQTEADTLRASLASTSEERSRLASDSDALRASLASAKEEHARLASEADTLRTSLASTQEERSRLASEAAALRASLASASGELARVERIVAQMRQSTGWRITAPLRYLRNLLGTLLSLLRKLPLALRILIRHRRSGIFDTAWYLEKNPDLRQSVSRPFVHFALHGVSEGRTPNAYVDGEYYLQRNSDAAASRANGLVHYALFGFWQNRPCCWLFDEEHYQKQLDHPREDLPNLLVHYFRHGWKEGKNPHPLFDARWYLEQNPDVAAAGMEPLRHYLLHGAAELRDPHPLFDARWYLEQNPDVTDAGMDPLQHYLKHGAAELRESKPASRSSAQNCIYLLDNRLKAKFAQPTSLPDLLSKLPFFDAEAYRRAYRDLADHADAAEHAGNMGIYEGRRILFPEPVQAAMQVLTRAPAIADSAPLPPAFTRCQVFVSSRGHFFMRELAERLASDLTESGIACNVVDETRLPETDKEIRNLVVAPHEFFNPHFLPRSLHKPWADARFHVLNTEQPHSSWFNDSLKYLFLAEGILDLSPHTAEAFRRAGLNAGPYVPRPHSDRIYRNFTPDTCSVLASYSDLLTLTGAQSPLEAQRPVDVSFVGGPSTRRETFFSRNARHFAQWRCCLYYRKAYIAPIPFSWPNDPEIGLGHYLGRHSKIYLNIHRDEVGYFELHRIVMQGIANGALVVSEESAEHPDFPKGHSYLSAPLDDIPELLRFLLESDEGKDTRISVAQQGYRNYLQSFGDVRSLQQVLQVLNATDTSAQTVLTSAIYCAR